MRGGRGAILGHLKKHKSITSMQAFELYGVTRLSAVIFDLRKLGYEIITLDVRGKNRFGEACVYAKYLYKGKNKEAK